MKNISLAWLIMRAEAVGKKSGPGFHVNTEASTNQLKAHSAGGRARGGASKWHVPARSSIFSRHRRGSAKRHSSFAFFCYSRGDKMFSNTKS